MMLVRVSLHNYSSVVLLAVYHKTDPTVCSWQNVLTGPAVNETNFMKRTSLLQSVYFAREQTGLVHSGCLPSTKDHGVLTSKSLIVISSTLVILETPYDFINYKFCM